jgi:hypothetical protein
LSLASGTRAYGDLESLQFLKRESSSTLGTSGSNVDEHPNKFDALISEFYRAETAVSSTTSNTSDVDDSESEPEPDDEREIPSCRGSGGDGDKAENYQPFSRSSTRSSNESTYLNAYRLRMQQEMSLDVDTSLCTIPPGFDRRRRSSVKPGEVVAAMEAHRRYSLSVSVSGVSCDEGASVGYGHSGADSDRSGLSNIASSIAESRSPSQRNSETMVSPHSEVSLDDDRSGDDASSVASSDSLLVPDSGSEANLTPKLRCPKAWRKFLGLDASMFRCAPTLSPSKQGRKGQGQPRYWTLKTNSRMIPKKQCHQLILQVTSGLPYG